MCTPHDSSSYGLDLTVHILLVSLLSVFTKWISLSFTMFLTARDTRTGLALGLHGTWINCDFLPAEVLLMAVKYAFPMDYK